MKKIIFFITLMSSIFVFSQAPQAFNYQATIRNSSGLLLTNQNVVLRVNIMFNSQSSTPVYSEIHSVLTDNLGYVNIVVGRGIPTTGTFTSINWSNGNYYLGIKLNISSGEIPIGTTQLLSVPYAFHANTSGSSANLASVLASNNDGNNLQIKNIADPTDNKDVVNKNYLEARVNSLESQITGLLRLVPSVTQQSICTGSLTNIVLTCNRPATEFIWTTAIISSPIGGLITGISNQNSGSKYIISQTLVNSGSSPGIVKYTATPRLGQIIGQPVSILVTVNPIPIITNKSISICSESTINIIPVNNTTDLVPNNTTYTWTTIDNTNILGEGPSTIPQTSISQTLTNQTNIPQNVIYTVTPKYLNCSGNSFTINVTVNPKPAISNKVISITSGTAFTLNPTNNISGDLVPINTLYTYTKSNNSNITGAFNQTIPQSLITQTLNNLTSTSQSIIFNVTPVSQGCIGTPFTITVTVHPNLTSVYPIGTIHCNIQNPTSITQVINPITGKVWMDRNLGASRVANSSTDTQAYGDLYQWGRRADGHQCRNSSTTTILSNIDQPTHNLFILSPNAPNDWRNPQNINLWQGVNGTNNPCPSGYRVPTLAEFNTEISTWINFNGFNSVLKLTLAGNRSYINGSLINIDTGGRYWTSTFNGQDFAYLLTSSNNAFLSTTFAEPAFGHSVRCIFN